MVIISIIIVMGVKTGVVVLVLIVRVHFLEGLLSHGFDLLLII